MHSNKKSLLAKQMNRFTTDLIVVDMTFFVECIVAEDSINVNM